MTARLPHFAIRRSDHEQPYHAVLVKNGRVIMSSETYRHKNAARRAIEIACGDLVRGSQPPKPYVDRDYIWHAGYGAWLRVDDETGKP